MFHAFCNKLSRACAKSGKEILFIPAITLIFTLIDLTQSTDKFIAFGPIGVMLAVTLGYDAIVGIAIVLLGVGVGFSVGALHTTTAVAQQISGLDLYSGITVRLVVTVIFYILTMVYICRYASRIKKDPSKSCLYKVEGVMNFDPSESEIQIVWKHFLVLAIFVAGLGILMWGCLKKGWSFQETSILFLWVGILSGLVYGIKPSQICKTFIKGCGGATGAALVVGFGAAVSLVLNTAGVIDTVVMGLAQALNVVPKFLRGPAMFLANVIINFFIPSGNGEAAMVMPIMAPPVRRHRRLPSDRCYGFQAQRRPVQLCSAPCRCSDGLPRRDRRSLRQMDEVHAEAVRDLARSRLRRMCGLPDDWLRLILRAFPAQNENVRGEYGFNTHCSEADCRHVPSDGDWMAAV